jgi:hypothetical protein
MNFYSIRRRPFFNSIYNLIYLYIYIYSPIIPVSVGFSSLNLSKRETDWGHVEVSVGQVGPFLKFQPLTATSTLVDNNDPRLCPLGL